jgi:FHS family Na+ dependent glucose MFS transporter 1
MLAGRLPKTLGYYAAFFAIGLALAALGPALPGLAANTQSDLSQISILFTARSLGFLLAASLGARLYDHAPGHPVMAGALFALAVAAALVPLTSLLWLLALPVLVLGLSEGMVDIGGNTLLVWVRRTNLGPWMNGLHLFFGAGALLSPIIMVQALAATGEIAWAFWILALLMLPVAGWLLCLPSPAIRGRPEAGREQRLNYRLVIPISLIFLLYVGAEASFGGWIYTYTVTLYEGTEVSAGYLTAAFWGALTVGRLLAIPISARLAPRWILVIDLLGCLVSVGLILARPDSLAAVWTGTVGTGLFMASIFPTLLTFADRRMTISGRVNGWFFAGSGLGGMALPWLIGQVFETAGPRSTMVIIIAAVLAALGILVGVVRTTQLRLSRAEA